MPNHSFDQQFKSQKLICCSIINKQDKRSTRYIELEHYKMWSYLMLHKHGLRIKSASLMLWVNESSFRENETIFTNQSEIEPVNNIQLILFDEINGFSHTISRYAQAAESAMVEEILLKHLSSHLYTNDSYDLTTIPGYCIKTDKDISKMVLGLSQNDERIWYREY